MNNTILSMLKQDELIKLGFSQEGASILFRHLNDGTNSFMIGETFDSAMICAYYKEKTLDQQVQEALDFYDGEYYIEATPECIREEFIEFGNKGIVGFTTSNPSVVYFSFDFAHSCYLFDQPTVD